MKDNRHLIIIYKLTWHGGEKDEADVKEYKILYS